MRDVVVGRYAVLEMKEQAAKIEFIKKEKEGLSKILRM